VGAFPKSIYLLLYIMQNADFSNSMRERSKSGVLTYILHCIAPRNQVTLQNVVELLLYEERRKRQPVTQE